MNETSERDRGRLREDDAGSSSSPRTRAPLGPDSGAVLIIALTAAVMTVLVAFAQLPWWAGTAALLVISAAVLLAGGPRTAGRLPRRRTGAQARTGAPDAGQLEILGEGLPEPFIVVDAGLAVVHANKLAAATFPNVRAGQHISAGLRAPVVLDAIRTVLETGRNSRIEFDQRVPVERHFEMHLAPAWAREQPRPAHAGGAAVMMVIRDLTRQEGVERMRADFIANVSHELRTPLASVLGLIETVRGPARKDARAQAQFLDLMQVQAGRMARLVDDLLSLSRIQLKAHVRPEGELDLCQAVRHVMDVLGPMAEQRGVEIVAIGLDEPVTVQGDRDELVQVFQNLIENAIKYGASGKRVEVERLATETAGAETAPVKTAIAVRDFGPGIAPEHLPRLTERFYRVDVADSREKGGTGLGLAIVKHILNRHGARLVVTSELGAGSQFTVEFPTSLGRALPPPRQDRPKTAPGATADTGS